MPGDLAPFCRCVVDVFAPAEVLVSTLAVAAAA